MVAGRAFSSVQAALCARGRRPAREPSAPRASLGASTRCPARPRHRPRAPQPGPPAPPAPSTPVGPVVLMRIHIIAEPTPNFACNSPETTSNLEFRSLELQRFQTLLKLLPIELHASFLEATPCQRPRAPQPCPPHHSQATQAGKNSPSTLKTPQNQHFFASRANFVTVRPMNHPPPGTTPTAQTSRGMRTRHKVGGTLAT